MMSLIGYRQRQGASLHTSPKCKRGSNSRDSQRSFAETFPGCASSAPAGAKENSPGRQPWDFIPKRTSSPIGATEESSVELLSPRWGLASLVAREPRACALGYFLSPLSGLLRRDRRTSGTTVWRKSALLVLFVGVMSAAASRAQDTTSKSAGQRTFVGADGCTLCHSKDAESARKLKAVFPGLVNDTWVRLDESLVWEKSDKHVQGFMSLKNDRSKQIGDRLGIAEIYRDKRCLACHTAFPLAALGTNPRTKLAEWADADYAKIGQGISCEGCHSPSGDVDGVENSGWIQRHWSKSKWRFLSATEKQRSFGFTDIRSPISRTRLCLSCHLGNADEGKIVTHEMYAAGHPPLPGFELSTFAAQMPKHWRDFDQKSVNVRVEFLAKSTDDTYGRDTYQLENLHETRNALVATLVSFSENLKLTGSLADDKFATPVLKPDWPELAQFECFACHHDLKDRGWRQRRTLRGAPGRPMLRAWPVALTKVALKTNGSDPNELDTRWRAVETLLSEQPFGRSDRWPDAIKSLTEWLDAQAAALERKSLPRDAGLIVFKDLAAVADSDFWDYDSARQLVWAAQVLRKELASDRSDETLRAKVAALDCDMAEIERLFVLDLIDGREATQTLPGSTTPRKVPEFAPEKTLPKIADYDAVTFRERFRKLASKLK